MSRERDAECGAGPGPVPVPGFFVRAASDHWPAGHKPATAFVPIEKVLQSLRLADTQSPWTLRIGPVVFEVRWCLGDPGAPAP